MPIWSLTQERVEKLLRQIGDKEIEIDSLIKLSKEDIWRQDLDEFINEWRFQLEDERRRERKVAGMGRRQSSKLMTSSKATTKKRKADEDEDYGAPKSKKSTATKKADPKGSLMSYLKSSSPKTTKVAQKDGTEDDEMDLDDDFVAEVMPKKSRAAPKAKPAPPKEVEEDDEDKEDDLAEVSATKAAPKAAPKAAGKAASKPAPSKKIPEVELSDSEESGLGDDFLDVSKMVKGIGDSNGKSLISDFSRPGTSAGLKTASAKSKPNTDFDPDETDYSKLVPQQSPRRSLLVKQKEKVAEDGDEEEEDDDEILKPAAKAKPAARGKAAAGAAKTTAARGRAKKDAAAPAPKKTPAATKAKGKPKKKADLSDDDIDAMANDILDSPAGDDSDKDEAPKARPSRRAASTKKKTYIIDDEDSEMDDPAGDDSADDFDDSE